VDHYDYTGPTSCVECIYMCSSRKTQGKFECHRSPPQLITTMHQQKIQGGMSVQVHSVWPVVDPELDWCGKGIKDVSQTP